MLGRCINLRLVPDPGVRFFWLPLVFFLPTLQHFELIGRWTVLVPPVSFVLFTLAASVPHLTSLPDMRRDVTSGRGDICCIGWVGRSLFTTQMPQHMRCNCEGGKTVPCSVLFAVRFHFGPIPSQTNVSTPFQCLTKIHKFSSNHDCTAPEKII